MRVKLKILQGRLKKRSGSEMAGEVNIHRPRFLIGGAEDCHMRCASRSVSSHHCEILVDERGVRVQDLHSETGTFVNDQPVIDETSLSSGDRLRIGRLEFSVDIEHTSETEADPVADFVSSLLVEADEQERARRLEDPEARQFHFDPDARVQDESAESERSKKLQRPARKPPRKLPPPPKFVAENTSQAAEETLKKIFTPKKL